MPTIPGYDAGLSRDLPGGTSTPVLLVAAVESDVSAQLVAWAGAGSPTSQSGLTATRFGEIEFSADEDWYGVSLTAGATYRFSMTANQLGPTSFDIAPTLRLIGTDGRTIISDVSSDLVSGGSARGIAHFSHTATGSGTFYLAALSFGFGSEATGAYQVTATRVGTSSIPTGTSGSDSLSGTSGVDRITGLAGNDTILGFDGNDILYGNQGADLLYGNAGVDELHGGTDADNLHGGRDGDSIFGNLGSDTIYGNLGSDTLYGGRDSDSLYGGQDNDLLNGDIGDDRLMGERGNDTLVASSGNDLLFGGDGADRFEFQVAVINNIINDFSGANGDRIALPRGATYTVTAISGGVEISYTGGGEIALLGVFSLSAAWVTTL